MTPLLFALRNVSTLLAAPRDQNVAAPPKVAAAPKPGISINTGANIKVGAAGLATGVVVTGFNDKYSQWVESEMEKPKPNPAAVRQAEAWEYQNETTRRVMEGTDSTGKPQSWLEC